jgi:hypothetical protein
MFLYLHLYTYALNQIIDKTDNNTLFSVKYVLYYVLIVNTGIINTIFGGIKLV